MKAMKDRGWHVIAAAPLDKYSDRLIEMGFEFQELHVDRKSTNLLKDILYIKRLITLFRHLKPEIVHLFTIKPVIYGSLVGQILSIPTVVCAIPGLGYVFLKRGLLQFFTLLMYKMAFYSRRVRIIFQNPEDMLFFLNMGLVKREQVKLVYGSGVNIDIFSPLNSNIKIPDHYNPNKVYFSLISRMLWDKGIREFVAAAKEVWKAYPQTMFQLIGGIDPGNPSSISTEWLTTSLNQKYMLWIDHVEDVKPLLAISDVVVLPSVYREGIPKSLIEAAAMGKPIIATDMPGCREIVQHNVNGILISSKSIPELTKAMKRMIENEKIRAQMGKNSRLIAVNRFTEKTVIKETLSVYFH